MYIIREKIKMARKNKCMTQEQLGSLLGKRRGTISKIECDKVPLTDDDIIAICKVLDIQPQSLFNEKIEFRKNNSKINSTSANDLTPLYQILNEILQNISSNKF